MRTISRSNRTVVVRVSCADAIEVTQRHRDTKAQRRAKNDLKSRASVPSCLCASVLFGNHIERKGKRVDLVVSPELRPGPVWTGLRHQTFERHIRTAAKFLEIRSRRNQELWCASIVVGLGENIQRMRMDVIHHILAHDQCMTERAKIR